MLSGLAGIVPGVGQPKKPVDNDDSTQRMPGGNANR